MNIGPRQTVAIAVHPKLGRGRAVYRNGPAFFIADSGEVEELRSIEAGGASSNPKRSWLVAKCQDKSRFEIDVIDDGKRHDRVVTEDGRHGWLSDWFDEFDTWCIVFEPDAGDALKFGCCECWVGGAKDKGKWPLPKERDHLRTFHGRSVTLTVWFVEQHPELLEGAPPAPSPQQEMFK